MQKTKRLYFIDAVRAFAILMMLQGHFIDTLIDPIYRIEGNTAYEVWRYFRGNTAPVFFTISGLVFTYLLLRSYQAGNDLNRIKKGLFRGVLLLFIGYVLRINLQQWFRGYFNPYCLVIDVLQCIGLSIIILIGLHVLFKKNSYLFSTILFVIGCLCFITEPLYRNIELPNVPLLFANYLTTSNGSIFTILPWFGYSAFGAFISTVFFRHVHRRGFKALTILSFLISGYALIWHSTWFLEMLYTFTNIELIKASAEFNYLFVRLGNVLLTFGLFYLFERFLKGSLISKIGRKTLSIYVIHFIILYGSLTGYGLKNWWGKSLNPTEVVIGAIIFMVSVTFIALNYSKRNKKIYELVRKLIFRIKEVKKANR